MEKTIIKYLPTFYSDLEETLNYISNVLLNRSASDDLLDEIENAILSRSEYPEAFEKYNSIKDRKNPYYRIYVKNYVIYYTVIPGNPAVMEIRRFLHNKRNMNKII